MSVDFYSQSIERRSDTARELRNELGVAGTMGKMSKPGLPRADLLRRAHRFSDAEVRWMLGPEERVQNQNVDSPKCIDRFLRKLLCIGDVTETPDAITVHRHRSVRDFYRKYVNVANSECLSGGDRMRRSFGFAGAGKRLDGIVEDVGEAL